MADTESGLNETSFRQRLKRETAAVHQHLEAQLGLLDPSLDVHRYLRVLERFYGFYVPVETDVERLAAVEPLGFPLRARAELIERDLLALGLSPADLAALPLCRDRPKLSCVEDLAGCLYVLEGASLGGQILSRLLHRRLGLTKGSGAASPATGRVRYRGGPSSWPGSTDCRARAYQPQRSSVPRRGRSMRSRDGRRFLEGNCRGRSERMRSRADPHTGLDPALRCAVRVG
jgi:heme oxygenase